MYSFIGLLSGSGLAGKISPGYGTFDDHLSKRWVALLKSPGWIVTISTPNFANSSRNTFKFKIFTFHVYVHWYTNVSFENVSYLAKSLDRMLGGTIHRET